MGKSRRSFLGTLGIGGAGVVSSSWLDRTELRLFAMGQQTAARKVYDIVISANENPRGPSNSALEALRGKTTFRVGRYPENLRELQATIAKMLGGKPENVLLATGSGMVLEGAGLAYTSPPKILVNGSPSYVRHSMRPEIDDTHGWASPAMKAAQKLVPVTKDLKLDLDGMAAAAKGAGMVFICNPNNPTSTVYTAKEIGDFIAKVKSTSPDTAIQIDEAYIDYADMPTVPTAAAYALQYPDVMITRTFSKAYGMAGLRLGYAFGQPATLKKVDLAYGAGDVNVLTAAAAIAALNDTVHMDAERKENKRVRDYTLAAFKEMGYDAPASHTNFVFVNIRRNAKAFRDACAKEKVFVGKSFPPLDKSYARITIGTWDEMHKAMEVFKRVLSEPSGTSAE